MCLIDAHLHLSAMNGAEETVAMSRALGMKLFSTSTDQVDTISNLRLRDAHPETVSCFAGVHPSKVSITPFTEELIPLIERADGVGEVGLDPKYSEIETGSAQHRSLFAQLEACERKEKPVQVHSRGAERQVLDALTSFRVKSVLLHWFEGEVFLSEASSSGYFISLGPALLYSRRLKRIAQRYPHELVLTESDAPVAYKPLGESAMGPTLIPSVVFALAEVWGSDYGETESRTSENARRFIEML
ncbi:MAG: TatD family hydrolase [Thaumarchaeota archaeon]|nr:TatD family hydrolase [Nitrososphaerota archaeon]